MPSPPSAPVLPSWWRRHPELALYALAVAVRIPVALATRTVGIDEALMAGYGASWLRTGVYSGIQWPIVYPVASAGLGFVVGARLAVELIFVLVGALAVIPLWRAMRELRGEEAATWGAGFVALLPAFSAVINKSGSHSIFLPLLGTAFLLHVRVLARPTARRLLALGLVLGLAYLTRADGIVFLGCVAASLLVVVGDGSATRAALLRQGAWRAAMVTLGALPLVAVNVAHVHHYTGRWALSAHVSSMLAHPAYMEGLKDGRLEEMTRSFEQADGSVASRLLRSPQYVARKIAYNARLCLRDLGDIYVFPAVFWTLLGLTVLSFVHGWRAGAWLLLVWSLPALAYLPLSIEARYFCPLAMMLGLFSGEGCVRLREAMEGRGLARAFRIVMAAGAAFLLALMAMAALVSRSGDEPGLADAAAAVRRDMDGKLGETFVFDPQLRFAVDGRPMGERSAPLTEECCAGSYVIEPARDAAAQRARLAQVERRGVRFERKPTTGSVEIWERVDAER